VHVSRKSCAEPGNQTEGHVLTVPLSHSLIRMLFLIALLVKPSQGQPRGLCVQDARSSNMQY
jgi:hypothetical protein